VHVFERLLGQRQSLTQPLRLAQAGLSLTVQRAKLVLHLLALGATPRLPALPLGLGLQASGFSYAKTLGFDRTLPLGFFGYAPSLGFDRTLPLGLGF
jgi:hypothetical protein